MKNTEIENQTYLVDVHGEKLIFESKREEENIDIETKRINKIMKEIKSLDYLFKLSTWKIFFTWVKENYKDVLILISGTGAIIQIKELANINLSYIKFFSATQLISDGVLVLLIAIIMTIAIVISVKLLSLIPVIEQIAIDTEKQKSFHFFEKYCRYFCTFIGSVVFAYGFTDITAGVIQKDIIFFTIFIAVILAFLAYTGMYYSVFDDYLSKTNDKFILFGKYNFKSYYRSFNRFMLIATAMTMIIVLLKSTVLIYAAARLPYNLENYNNLRKRIESEYKDITYYKLLYYNDVYAFIEIKKDKDSEAKVIIYKTDAIIFGSNLYKKQDDKDTE